MYGLAALSLAIILSSVVSAQSNRTPFSAMQWRLVGPFRGGRSLAATGVSGNPYVFYFGSVDGGVWKTENAGVTWQNMSTGLTNSSVGALVVAPSDPKILYAGTGECDMRSDMTYGDGVYKSTDGGLHWDHLGLDDTRHIGRILVDPHNPNLVLVAALGHAYGPNEERGIYRSTDGGETWTKVLYKSPDVGAVDLGWDPENTQLVYAAMWQARRTPWSQYPPDEGPGSGLFKSTDEGLTWSELNSPGLPAKPYGRIGVSVARGSQGKIVYALVEDLKKGSGLYRSDDAGETWRLAGNDKRIAARMWYFSQVSVDPENPDVIYCPNVALMRSADAGKTFSPIKGAPGGDDYHFLWIDPTNHDRMILASDQGTVVSVDGAKTWSSWYNQPTGQFYHVATDDQFPYRIYGAQQDAGTASIVTRSDYGSITYRDWHPVGSGESGYIAPDPADPDVVYGGDTYGGVFRFDTRTGQSQVISPSLLAEFGKPISSRKLRFTWTSPIVFDKHDAHVLYFGSQKLLRSNDGGLSWDEISPDLTRNTGIRSDSTHSGWGVIYSIAPSPVQREMIWIGTDDGYIQLTRDGGKDWDNVTPKELKAWNKIGMIDASPFDAGEAYAAVDKHRLDDQKACIYRTTDFGKNWTRADSGIPDGSYVNVVRSDLTRKGLLYAGTETGVYISFNDGDNWQPLQLNLPIVSVRDLAVHQNDLVAATHGRAFWALDDLSPLQQMSETVLDSSAHLFEPERAVRIRRSENSDTPLPPEEPQGTNPPSGAIIDYYLRENVRGPIELEILDKSGNIVRRFSSDQVVPADTEHQPVAHYWHPENEKLPNDPGLNRFVWDLCYPPPPGGGADYGMAVANGRSVMEPQGPLVLPGKYQVRLSAAGRVYVQSLNVVLDPRVTVDSKALERQLALAIEIWNTTSDIVVLRSTLDSTFSQLDEVEKVGRSNPTLESAFDSLVSNISKLRRALDAGAAGNLEMAVMSADRQPTRQMSEAYDVVKKELHESESRWNKLAATDLRYLDRLLLSAGLNPIRVVSIKPEHLRMP